MNCPHCGYAESASVRHCTQCGFALWPLCRHCGFLNPTNASFCGQCAASLAAPSQASVAERRQISVLFSDVVSSAVMSQQLDPEDLRDLLRAYQARCGQVLRELGGYVAQYLGDGVLAYFGYPIAHEDDARRAVLAALRIQEVVSRLETSLPAPGNVLGVRVSVHTGPVVIGEMGAPERREFLAIGETPNLAARLQSEAAPGTVIVSEATYRLTRDDFVYQALGARTFKGFGAPVPCHQPLAHNRTRRMRDRPVPPLVDRTEELSFLLDQWRNTASGGGTIVALGGEAGIGKSRLVRALCERLTDQPHRTLECQCSPLFSNTALHPWIDMLERELQFKLDTTPAAKWRLLLRFLKQLGLDTPRRAALLAPLLSVEVPSDYLPSEPRSSPLRERQARFECLLECLDAFAARQPVLCVVEDLHWADPSTLELIGMAVAREVRPRIMMLVSHRREFNVPWPAGRITARSLPRLTAPDAVQIVAGVVREHSFAPDVVQEVVARADGVPLYLEEITKAVLESREAADGRKSPLPGSIPPVIPASLQDSLTARLDRLGSGKPVLQLAAVLGRTFNFEWLRAVSDLDDAALRTELEQLTHVELLFRTGKPADETYAFKHSLIQDAAYESLLRATRHAHHKRIAITLAEQFPELASAQPELPARHYAGAGMAQEAMVHWALAGAKALSRSAYAEATHAYGAALEQLESLPPGESRDQREIELRLQHGTSMTWIKGYTAPEVEQTYNRAYELCARYPDAPPGALFGLMSVYIVRSERDTTERLVAMIERVQPSDPADIVTAPLLLAIQAFFAGRYDRALECLQRAMQYIDYTDLTPLKNVLAAGENLEVFFNPLLYAAWSHALCGRPDQAWQLTQRALDIAAQLEHPFTHVLTLDFAAQVNLELRHDLERTREQVLRGLALAIEHCFPFWIATARNRLGLIEEYLGGNGIEHLQAGLGMLRAMGSYVVCPTAYTGLAEAHLMAGRAAEALATLEEALAFGEDKLTGSYYPRLLAQRGRARLMLGDVASGESDLRQALELVRGQSARWLELGIAFEFARLLAARDRRAEARELLEPICGWFGDRTDLERLTAARELLATLA